MARGTPFNPFPAAAMALVLIGTGPVAAQMGVTTGTETVPAAPSAAPANPDRASISETRTGAFIEQVPDTLLRLSKVVGVGVIGADHTRLGDIQDVLLDREGKAQAVVIGAGGFLGLGEKGVAVPFGSVAWNTGVRPNAGPSASMKPADAPPQPDPAKAAEAMPGKNVADENLGVAADQQQTGRSEGGSGASRAEAPAATALATNPDGRIEHAEVHLTKADLQGAPAFRYGGEAR